MRLLRIVVPALVLLLAACSPDATPTPTLVITTATPTPAVDATSAPPPEGTLRVAVIGAAPHQDLHRMVSEWATLFGSGLGYNRLLRFVTGPGTLLPSLAVECDLCSSWTWVDWTMLEVDLNPRAMWQDAEDFASRPVSSEDVVWSLRRLRELGSPHERLLDSVDVIEQAGPSKVRFRLHYPDADLLLKLASPYAVILAPESLNAVNLQTGRVLGAGPWRYVRGATGQVSLQAWDAYFRAGEPAAKAVQFLPVSDLATGVTLLEIGVADMAQVTELRWASLDQGRFKSEVIDRQGRGVLFGVNAGRTTLADQVVRQAIFAALDPHAAIAESLGIGWVGTGMPAIEPSWVLDDALIAGAFGARASNSNVGPDEGPDVGPLTLTIGNFGEYHVAHGEAIAAQLTAAGFDVTTDVVSRGAYVDRVWERRDYDLFVGPMPPTDTPSAFLLALLHTQGASNVTGAGTAALDALIEAQAVELDDARREDMIRNIQAGSLDGAWFFMAAGLSERWAFSERVVSPPLAFPVGSGDWWKYVAVVEHAP